MTDDTTTTTPTASDDTSDVTPAKKRPWQRFSLPSRTKAGSGTAAAKTSGSSSPSGSSGSSTAAGHSSADRVRVVLARVLWGICALFASILAVAVLLIAIDANPGNDLVLWIIERADNVDLGYFDLENPIKDFDTAETNPAEDVKTALVNYGIAALIWLGLGKFLDKVVRP